MYAHKKMQQRYVCKTNESAAYRYRRSIYIAFRKFTNKSQKASGNIDINIGSRPPPRAGARVFAFNQAESTPRRTRPVTPRYRRLRLMTHHFLVYAIVISSVDCVCYCTFNQTPEVGTSDTSSNVLSIFVIGMLISFIFFIGLRGSFNSENQCLQ